MDYYQKYLKYKNKYETLKKQYGGDTEYPVMNYVEGYKAEVRDYLHRPSAIVNNFNPLLQVYLKNNSVPYKNNYFVDFIDVYKNYDKLVTYLSDEQLVNYECVLADDRITSPYLERIMKTNRESGKPFRRLIYISDMFGKVYVIDKTNVAKKDEQINHTTLSKGKLVSSAGWIVLDNDFKIKEISNLTGHYQSADILVYNFLKILIEHGFSLTDIHLEINRFEGGEVLEPICTTADVWFEKHSESLSKESLSIVDKINYLVSTKIYNLKIKADFINLDIREDSYLLYLIFQTNDSMYKFVSENNLIDIFNLENSNLNEVIETNSKYFVNNQIGMMEVVGVISGINVRVVITSYEKLQNYFAPITTIRSYSNNLLESNYLRNGYPCNIYKLEKNIGPSSWVSEEYLLISLDNNILFGKIALDLLKDSYKIVYSLGYAWEKYIKIFTKTVIESIVLEKNKCFQNADNLSPHVNLTLSYENYVNEFCQSTIIDNFISSNLWRPNYKTGYVNSFSNITSINDCLQLSTLNDVPLIYNFIKSIEKISNEYFTGATISQSTNTLSIELVPVSITLFREKTRLTINKKEYKVNNIIEDSIKVINESYINSNLKINGRNLSLKNIYICDNNVCLDDSTDTYNLVHPCVNLARIIAEIIIKNNLTKYDYKRIGDIIYYEFKTTQEQNLMLKIIINGLLIPLLSTEPDKSNIKGWDEILRSSVFIELMKMRENMQEDERKLIEVIGIEILNKINKYTSNNEIPPILYFNKLMNEAKFILQV